MNGDAQAHLENYGWTWPSIVDEDRSLAGSLGAAYQPVVILIDSGGGIVAAHIGSGSAEEWEVLAAQL